MKLTTKQKQLVKEYAKKLVESKKVLKEFISYDDPNLIKAYSHDRMGYVIADSYITALESMGYSKEEIYEI